MSAHRKPTEVMRLTGALNRNKQRHVHRANEPKPEGDIGNAPRYFSKEQKAIWRELIKQAPPGVLKDADRLTVELAVLTMERIRNGSAMAAERTLMVNLLGRLAMTPADRSRVQVAPQKKAEENDPWATFCTPSSPTSTPGT